MKITRTIGFTAVALLLSLSTLTASAATVKTTHVAFKGSYHGTIALLWSSTGVTATAVHGTGNATKLGASTMSGKGNGTAANTCNPFSGSGLLSGAGSTLKLSITTSTSTQACAVGQAAPTVVLVKGTAK